MVFECLLSVVVHLQRALLRYFLQNETHIFATCRIHDVNNPSFLQQVYKRADSNEPKRFSKILIFFFFHPYIGKRFPPPRIFCRHFVSIAYVRKMRSFETALNTIFFVTVINSYMVDFLAGHTLRILFRSSTAFEAPRLINGGQWQNPRGCLLPGPAK